MPESKRQRFLDSEIPQTETLTVATITQHRIAGAIEPYLCEHTAFDEMTEITSVDVTMHDNDTLDVGKGVAILLTDPRRKVLAMFAEQPESLDITMGVRFICRCINPVDVAVVQPATTCLVYRRLVDGPLSIGRRTLQDTKLVNTLVAATQP